MTKNGSYQFRVPNDDEGHAFIALCRKYAYYPEVRTIRVRGSGPRKAPALADGQSPQRYRQDLPTRHAVTLRLYLGSKSAEESLMSSYSREHRYAHDLRCLTERLDHANIACGMCESNLEYERIERTAAEIALAKIPAWLRRLCFAFHAWRNQ